MTIDPLLQAILDSPADHFLKSIYADHLEEQGRNDEAKAWRWIAKNGKYPTDKVVKYKWDWFVYEVRWSSVVPETCLIPGKFYDELLRGRAVRARYKTQLEAWNDLIRVLLSLNEEEWDNGNY